MLSSYCNASFTPSLHTPDYQTVFERIAIRIHFSRADENMLPQPRILHWVVLKFKVTVYCVIAHHKVVFDTDVQFLVGIFLLFETYCVPFVENRVDLMLQNTNDALANVHPQVWLHVAMLRPQQFSDEAHFWLNGYVNKQNCRIWSEANPQVYVETPLHPEKLTVWCALWAGGIISPYFFKNDEGHNVTVNGDRYRAMITNFFIPELNNHDVQELWFQQDGATCHTARAIIDLLKDTFGDRLISRFGPVNWPPRSCDLTPLDYFLWGYVKSLVYADKPQTPDHLEDNIRRVIADIRPQMLEKSSKIGRPDWTTSEPAVAVICQKSYLKCNAKRLSFE
ncbi:DUF4817 domain-containing protein [Trichonephila clavipes]|nr:DUF4817 domain-containing protein [Trichonephila clavipes]